MINSRRNFASRAFNNPRWWAVALFFCVRAIWSRQKIFTLLLLILAPKTDKFGIKSNCIPRSLSQRFFQGYPWWNIRILNKILLPHEEDQQGDQSLPFLTCKPIAIYEVLTNNVVKSAGQSWICAPSSLFGECELINRSWLEWILQNQVSARRLELNKIIFRQIAPTFEISIKRLKKAKMRMVTPKYGSKPT